MIWEKIRGHEGAINVLRRSAAAGRLPHALLFVGPPGVGKSLVARTLAMALLCERFSESQLEACGECRSCRLMLAGTHPDFLPLACPEGKSELPIELLVGSRENRGREGLCHDLSLRPMMARRRVAVIEDADRMSLEAANALLKTLEEPPPYAVIVLIAGDSASILPTIRSRCQTVRFSALAAAEIAQLVLELEWTDDAREAEAAAALADGSLTVAQQLLNSQLRAARDAVFQALARVPLRSFTLAQMVLGALEQMGGETQAQRANAQWIVRFAVDFFRNALECWGLATGQSGKTERKIPSEVAEFIQRFPPGDPTAAEIIGAAIERCVDAEEQLAANVSIPLCLEAFFGDLATILEPASVR
jgi:DNA polymerase III subunit delta'